MLNNKICAGLPQLKKIPRRPLSFKGFGHERKQKKRKQAREKKYWGKYTKLKWSGILRR